MSNDKLISVELNIHSLIQMLTDKSYKIVESSSNTEDAINKILNLVSREVSEKTTGLLNEIYTILSEYTLSEPTFENAARANSFYDLELDSKIFSSYIFEAKSLNEYCKEEGFKKIANTYYGIGATLGTLALGSILIASLDKKDKSVPFIILVAGALAVGLLSYFKAGNVYDRKKFKPVVKKYLDNLETELIHWIKGIEQYYDLEVEKLLETFERKGYGREE